MGILLFGMSGLLEGSRVLRSSEINKLTAEFRNSRVFDRIMAKKHAPSAAEVFLVMNVHESDGVQAPENLSPATALHASETQ
jgi:hypothetical protein